MNIVHFRTFVAVARTGNISRAAKFLHLSQPAVSGQIKALEEELGSTLFERTPSGVKLTSFGVTLLPEAELINATVKAILDRSKTSREQVAGRLRVATIVNPDFLDLGRFMRRMRERFPLVNIELQHCLSGQALAGVLDGEISVGFFIGEDPHPPVAAVRVKRVPYVVAAPAGWKERVQAMSLDELATLPWIASPKLGSRHHLVNKLFADSPSRPSYTVEANSESTILSLVFSGMGLALVREEAVRSREQSGRCAVWDKVRYEADLLFIYHQDCVAEPAVKAAVDVIREMASLSGHFSDALWKGNRPDGQWSRPTVVGTVPSCPGELSGCPALQPGHPTL